MCVRICACLHMCVCACASLCVCLYVCVRVCPCMCECVCVYICMCVYVFCVYYLHFCSIFSNRESASCTHVSAVLHALASVNPTSSNLKPIYIQQGLLMVMKVLLLCCHVCGRLQGNTNRVQYLCLKLFFKNMITLNL